MFPRRRTDQVYATLQQVQRRITDANSGAAPAAPVADGKPAIDVQSPFVFGANRPGVPGGRAPVPEGVVPLTRNQAGTLLLLWIATCVLAFVLGKRAGALAPVVVASTPPEMVAHADPAPAPAADMVLQLLPDQANTAAMRDQLQKQADGLNKIMIDNAGKGWKPYFAVREAGSGALQLIYGRTEDGHLGIDSRQFADFARLLQQPQAKGGAGFPSAVWVPAH
jgi:hypothetical protein